MREEDEGGTDIDDTRFLQSVSSQLNDHHHVHLHHESGSSISHHLHAIKEILRDVIFSTSSSRTAQSFAPGD